MRLGPNRRNARKSASRIISPGIGVPEMGESISVDLSQELADCTVFARVVRHHVMLEPGVVICTGGLLSWLRRAQGVTVKIRKNGSLWVRISLQAHYGFELRELGERVAQAAAVALQRLSERPVESIEVDINRILYAE